MIDRPFEDLLAGWYRARAEAEPVPLQLRARVLALPEGYPIRLHWQFRLPSRPQSTIVVVALLAALLLALAMTAAGMAPRLIPDRSLAFPRDLDACAVLRDSTAETREFDHGMTAWSAHVCAVGWDGGWNNPHLLLRVLPTTASEARAIIANRFNWLENARPSPPPLGNPAPSPQILLGIANGTWIEYAQGVWMGCPAPGQRPFLALAVSAEPFFFVVTGPSSRVRQRASDVAQRLGTEVGVPDDLAAARPTCALSP